MKHKDIWVYFQTAPFCFGDEILVDKAEFVKWRLAVNFCRNGDVCLSLAWSGEDSAHPKTTRFCEPSPPFPLPSWASQLIHWEHILMVLIWSWREGLLQAGYSARQYQRVRHDPSLLPGAALALLDCARSLPPFLPKFRACSNLSKSCFIALK